jgi:nucleoid DNA-binding protein
MGLSKINRVEVIKEIANELDVPYSKARGVIDEVFNMTLAFMERPYEHDKVAVFLKNFGIFEPVQKKVMAKAFKATKQKEDWIKFKDSVVEYYDRKKSKNYSGKIKRKRIDNSEQGDYREE